MLPGAQGEEDEEHRSFYSFSERKLYDIHLPQIRGQHCVGSGKGWIITVNNLTGNLQLLDFVTGSTTSLPSITTFSDVADTPVIDDGDGGRRLKGYMCRETRPKVVDPHNYHPDDLLFLLSALEFKLWELEHIYSFYKKAFFFPSVSLIFVIYNSPTRLAFARLGDVSWNEFDIDCNCIRDVLSCLGGGGKAGAWNTYCRWFDDVVFHKGQFYTTLRSGWIMALDLSSTPPRCACLHLNAPPKLCCGDVVDTSYLVESPDGAQLMLVRRIVNLDYSSYRTNTFNVFKCKLNNDGGDPSPCQEEEEEEEAKWVEVKCLDEWVLFLGDNLSLALSANDFPELTPNSIYFTNNVYMASREVTEFELGVFHLESGIIEPLLFPNNKSWSRHMAWPLPVWIPHTESFPVATQIAKVYTVFCVKLNAIYF